LYFVEKIPALDTHKRINKAIHPQFPIKYAREVTIFVTNGFSNDSSSASQSMCLKYFACWGIYDIDPFNNSFSFRRNPHMYF